MVRNYVNKDQRLTWNELAMAKAVESVVSGEMGYSIAAKSYRVPRSTLRRRVKFYKLNSDMEYASSKGNYNKNY